MLVERATLWGGNSREHTLLAHRTALTDSFQRRLLPSRRILAGSGRYRAGVQLQGEGEGERCSW